MSRVGIPVTLLACMLVAATGAVAQQPNGSPFAPGGPLAPLADTPATPSTSHAAPVRTQPHVTAQDDRSPRESVNPAPQAPPSGRDNEPPAHAIWLEGHLGLGTPLGNLAAALDVQPVPWFALNAGVGRSVDGTQIGVMPRLRLRAWEAPLFVSLGGGYSRGPYTHSNHAMEFMRDERASDYERTWKEAAWANGELSLESRVPRLGWRGYVGVAKLLSHTASSCRGQEEACSGGVDHLVVYLGFALALGGWWH